MLRNWDALERLVGSATDCLTFVAPFVKREVLERLLAVASPAVTIACYTRWVPSEVARGVSDPDIVSLPRLSGRVYLCPCLHAKVFVADDRAIVGSANLTAKALGLAQPSNLEVLIEVPANHPTVARLLDDVRASSHPANDNLARAVLSIAAAEQSGPEAISRTIPFHPWSRAPEAVWAAYSGVLAGPQMSADLAADLLRLGLPHGLSEREMRAIVQSRLLEHPALSLLSAGTVERAQIVSTLCDDPNLSGCILRLF